MVLTAEGIHQRLGRNAPALVDVFDLLFKITLAGHLGLVQYHQFSIQN